MTAASPGAIANMLPNAYYEDDERYLEALAEAMREELQQFNESDGVLFKMKNDPRITPFGHFDSVFLLPRCGILLRIVAIDRNLHDGTYM